MPSDKKHNYENDENEKSKGKSEKKRLMFVRRVFSTIFSLFLLVAAYLIYLDFGAFSRNNSIDGLPWNERAISYINEKAGELRAYLGSPKDEESRLGVSDAKKTMFSGLAMAIPWISGSISDISTKYPELPFDFDVYATPPRLSGTAQGAGIFSQPAEQPHVVRPDPPVPRSPQEAGEFVAGLKDKYANDDIVGYVKIDGTNVSYPVVLASDNDFYQRRDIYGNASDAGAIFMDYENSPGELGDNTVIYGHNMRNGSMFHNLRYYSSKNYYESHPYIVLTTESGETVWEIFAFYHTDINFNYIQTSFESKEAAFGLLLQMKLKSIYDTGILVKMGDKALTLSTCASEGGDARYVLSARLIN